MCYMIYYRCHSGLPIGYKNKFSVAYNIKILFVLSAYGLAWGLDHHGLPETLTNRGSNGTHVFMISEAEKKRIG